MARKQYPSDQLAQFMLRLPEGLRDRIKGAAEREGRSMNSEIVRVLEKEFPSMGLNIDLFTNLLESLNRADTHPDGAEAYLEEINDALSVGVFPYTVTRSEDGALKFQPNTKVKTEHHTDVSEADE